MSPPNQNNVAVSMPDPVIDGRAEETRRLYGWFCEWACVAAVGVNLYSIDDARPYDLTVGITPYHWPAGNTPPETRFVVTAEEYKTVTREELLGRWHLQVLNLWHKVKTGTDEEPFEHAVPETVIVNVTPA